MRSTLRVLLPLALAAVVRSQGAPPPAQEPPPQSRSGFEELPQFGGPSAVGAQLEEDDAVVEPAFRFDGLQRVLAPYFDFKGRLKTDYGLAFGGDYSAVFLTASDSLGEDDAASGMLRLFGSWTLVNRDTENTGSIVYKVEHRHRYTDIAASQLGFETGYVGLWAPPFNNRGLMLTNLYWQQRTSGGHLNFVAGWVDATDYLDVYGLVNPWTHFVNLAFSTGSGSIPVPDQGLGAAVGAMLSHNVYAVGGLADSNGDPTDPGEGFDTFFDDHEYFSHVELGWTTSFERRYLDNMHLTLWHAAEREAALVPDGWGANFSFTRFIKDTFMPFVRAGYASDGGSLLERTVSVGVGYYMPSRSDLLGVGLNWGRPNTSSFGSGLDDQYTAELFYRFQFSQNFAVTPDLQFIVDPALNPNDDFLAVFGVRARLTF